MDIVICLFYPEYCRSSLMQIDQQEGVLDD
jgi:hypothetical protein